LALWLAEVVQTESPVHVTEAVRRIYSVAGVRRASKAVQASMDDAVGQLVQSGRISRRGDFLWSTDMSSRR
jgi:hypothetical protein